MSAYRLDGEVVCATCAFTAQSCCCPVADRDEVGVCLSCVDEVFFEVELDVRQRCAACGLALSDAKFLETA